MTIKEITGCDGIIVSCCLCGYRIVRRGYEEAGNVTRLMDGERYIGLAHDTCAAANGGVDEKA